MARRQAVTISDVAHAAGVSRSTVSRVFSQPSLFLPATVTRVQEAAANLGYTPNPQAKALSTGTMAAIGIVVADIANPFFPPFIRAAGLRATQSEVAVLIADTEENPDIEAAALERLASRTDGIILVSSRQSASAVLAFAQKTPLVVVNRDIAGIPRVLVSTEAGIHQAVEHLAGLGHRHIAYLVGPKRSWSNQERLNAANSACMQFDLELTLIKGYMPTYEDGARSSKAVVKSGATALVAFDDLMAQGAMAGLADMEINVPADMSVIGCDDLLAARTYPQMTSIKARSPEAGVAAVDLLLADAQKDTRLVLPGEFILRSTTAPPRAL